MTDSDRESLKRFLPLLLEAHQNCDSKRLAYKINAVILLARDFPYDLIERALLLDERTVRRYRDLFLEGGLDALEEERYQGGRSKLSEEQRKELERVMQEHLFSTAEEVAGWIKERWGIDYTPQGLVPVLHRLDFSWKKTKVIPGKADIEKQKIAVEEYRQIRENLGKDERIYFGDAVHPTHNMMPGYAWIKTGEEREIRTNTGRERINILGAYGVSDQDTQVKDFETINRLSVLDFLKEFDASIPKEIRVIHLWLDNAKYNHAKIVKEYLSTSRIKVHYLPSYSPNLNLIERLWKHLIRHVIRNRYHATFTEFREAVLAFLRNKTEDHRAALKSLITENFHVFNSS
jgi:transposase